MELREIRLFDIFPGNRRICLIRLRLTLSIPDGVVHSHFIEAILITVLTKNVLVRDLGVKCT